MWIEHDKGRRTHSSISIGLRGTQILSNVRILCQSRPENGFNWISCHCEIISLHTWNKCKVISQCAQERDPLIPLLIRFIASLNISEKLSLHLGEFYRNDFCVIFLKLKLMANGFHNSSTKNPDFLEMVIKCISICTWNINSTELYRMRLSTAICKCLNEFLFRMKQPHNIQFEESWFHCFSPKELIKLQ